MSDTIKLIIEISKDKYERCKEHKLWAYDAEILEGVVAMGIPLDKDSEQAEVQAYFAGEAYGWEQGRKALIEDIKTEIAEEICLTDNPYTKETKYTIEHSKLLDILDNLEKESEE